MGIRIIKLPDVGEGVAEAELVETSITERFNVSPDSARSRSSSTTVPDRSAAAGEPEGQTLNTGQGDCRTIE